MNEIGKVIKEYRLHSGMNITELAKKSKISRPYLSQIESGNRKPSPEILDKLSVALNVPLIELMHKAGHIPDNVYNEHWDFESLLFEDELEIRKSLDQIIELMNQRRVLNAKLKNNQNQKSHTDIKQQLNNNRKNIAKKYNSILKVIEKQSEHDKELDRLLDLVKESINSNNDGKIQGLLIEFLENEKNSIREFSESQQWTSLKHKLLSVINPFDLMTPEEEKDFIEEQHKHLEFSHYEFNNYPDIKQLLENGYPFIDEVYYDKKKLDKDIKELFIKVLNGLTADLEENYPTDDEIEKEIERLKEVERVLNERNKNN